jgi:hypothetical protein
LKGYELKRLREKAEMTGGLAVLATLQPSEIVMRSSTAGGDDSQVGRRKEEQEVKAIHIGSYTIFFYSLLDWKTITPW